MVQIIKYSFPLVVFAIVSCFLWPSETCAQAPLEEFTYNGTTYRGSVVQVIPASVKIKSEDGRVGTFSVDNLDLKFAAGLDIPNSPYKKLLDKPGSQETLKTPSPIQTTPQPPVPKRSVSIAEKQVGEIKVELVSVAIAPFEFNEIFGNRKVSANNFLLARLKVTNTSTTKIRNYNTWRGESISITKDFASLSDDFGNSYKRISTDTKTPVDSVERSVSIYPGKSVADTLVFELPIDSAKTLTLDMPGENIGQGQSIKFTIPIHDVDKR